jgi:hypothetical protein
MFPLSTVEPMLTVRGLLFRETWGLGPSQMTFKSAAPKGRQRRFAPLSWLS